jgi:hypothetical protein
MLHLEVKNKGEKQSKVDNLKNNKKNNTKWKWDVY